MTWRNRQYQLVPRQTPDIYILSEKVADKLLRAARPGGENETAVRVYADNKY
jgi:hypothetical protein